MTRDHLDNLSYHHFFQLSPDMLALLDATGRFLEINPAWEGITGFTGESLRQQSLLELIHPEDRPDIRAIVQRLQTEARTHTLEARCRHRDGSYLWLAWRMSTLSTEGLIYAIARNVTQHKQAEADAQKQHRELELLNRVIAASATNLEPEELLEMACRELALTFAVSKTVAALFNKEKTEERVVAEYLGEGQVTTIGKTVRVADSASLQYLLTYRAPLAITDAQNDPRLAHVHDLLRDRGVVSLLMLPLTNREAVIGSLILETVTPHHFTAEEISLAWSVADQVAIALTQTRMAQTHYRLLTALEQTTDSILVTDANDVITYVNPAFERLTGYSQAEVVGRTPADFLEEAQNDPPYATVWAAISQGQVWQGRLTSRKKDGDLLVEDVTITPVRDGQHQISSYVTVRRDVTQELRLEAQLRQSQKLEAVGQLAGGIAHDFNNLLMIITGHTELLLTQANGQFAAFQPELVEIKKAADRATTLTRQLLAFSRKQLLQPREVDLNRILGGIQTMFKPLLKEDIDFLLDLTYEPAYIKADPGQIEQIILNLVINARDAMPDGGRLILQTDVIQLTEAEGQQLGLEPDGYVLLTVSDTGVGMDADTQSRIFEPFFTTKEIGQGTGLGLATTYGIIQQSKGHILVDSKPGQGTTFKIYLPHLPHVAPTAAPEPETILVVEDEADVRRLVKKMLKQEGYHVLEATNGQEALEVGQKQATIHLLITDVVMPLMGGQELVQHLLPHQTQMSVLYISGYSDKISIPGHIPGLRADFLFKPFSAVSLKGKVREILGNR